MTNEPTNIKLWLDDERQPPNDEWTWTKGYAEAMGHLRAAAGGDEILLAVSFDHDLGEGGGKAELTGHDVALKLVALNVRPKVVMVHTQNPVGRDKIVATIKEDLGYRVAALVNIGACKLCPLLLPSIS